jgi:hypothetical protein
VNYRKYRYNTFQLGTTTMTTSEFIKTANALGLEKKANAGVKAGTKGLQFLRGMLDVPRAAVPKSTSYGGKNAVAKFLREKMYGMDQKLSTRLPNQNIPIGSPEAKWRAAGAGTAAGGLLGTAAYGLSNLLPGASLMNLKNKKDSE